MTTSVVTFDKIMTTLLRDHCSTPKNSSEGIMLMQIQYYSNCFVLDCKVVCSTTVDSICNNPLCPRSKIRYQL
jgi:hypothetical protein